MSKHDVEMKEQFDVATWEEGPYNRWAYQHMDEILPTVALPSGKARSLLKEERDLGGITFESVQGEVSTVDHFLETTYTDGFLVWHEGKIICERYFDGMTPSTPHLSQSVTKSFIGALCGLLHEQGALPLEKKVGEIIPELASSGYGDATVNHVLNMRTGVDYAEDYADPESGATLLTRAMGWMPQREGDPQSIRAYLPQVKKSGDHGGAFQYRSADTEVLTWIVEKAAGCDLCSLLKKEILDPMGAEHDLTFAVDSAGVPITCGGLSISLRDLLRFGLLYLEGKVVSKGWIDATRQGDNSVFGETPFARIFPEGAYSQQWWVVDNDKGLLCALGAFGQMIYLDPDNAFAVVKLSSRPTVRDFEGTVNGFRAVESIRYLLSVC